MDVDDLIQISLGDAVKLLVYTVDALDHISVHVAGDHMRQNQCDCDQTDRKGGCCGRNPLIQIPAGEDAPDVVFAGLFKYTVGSFAVHICIKAFFMAGDRIEAWPDFRKIFPDAG